MTLFSRSYGPALFHVPYPEEPPASEMEEPLYASADSLSGYEEVDTRKPGKAEYGPGDYAQVLPRDQRVSPRPEGVYASLDRDGIHATPADYEPLPPRVPPRTPPRTPPRSPEVSTRSEQIYFELECPPEVPPKPAKRPSEPTPSIGGGQKAQFSLVNEELKQRFANRSGS